MNVSLPMDRPCQKLCYCWGAEGWRQKMRNLASLIQESTPLLCQIPGASYPPHLTGRLHWYCYTTHPSVRVVSPPDDSLQGNTSGPGMCPFHLGPYRLWGVTAERSEQAWKFLIIVVVSCARIREMLKWWIRWTSLPGRLRCKGFLLCLGRRYPHSESSLGVACMVLSAWYKQASVTLIILHKIS